MTFTEGPWTIDGEPHQILFLFTLAVTDVRKLQEDLSVGGLDRKTTKFKAKSVIFVISKYSEILKLPKVVSFWKPFEHWKYLLFR